MRNLTSLVVLGSTAALILALSACSTGKLAGDSGKKGADGALTTNDAGSSGGGANASGTPGESTAVNGSGSGSGSSSGSGSGSACPTAATSMSLTSHDHDSDHDKESAKEAKACEDSIKIAKGVKKCLDSWGGAAPFTTASPYRKIAAAVTVLGAGNAIDDSAATTEPQLVVIAAAVSVLSQPHYRLMNPKGWYCLIADVNVGSKLNIDLHTTAHIADARVNVGVLNSGSNAGIVDVNVLSDVKVNRLDK